jgi:hypothetical protein
MANSVIGSLVSRKYQNFRGIDLYNHVANVDLTRSPDCLNVWKNYDTEESNIIQTRPGIEKIDQLSANGTVYSMMAIQYDTALVHIGTDLVLWNGFPESVIQLTVLKADMNDAPSKMINFNGVIYILDGAHFLSYDGTLNDLIGSSDAYIPTTTISRNPAGGGEWYEDINMLSPYRINTFLGDGTSTDYYLDDIGITSVEEVSVNGTVLTTGYSVDTTYGKVSFTSPPPAPVVPGQDNVKITFKKVLNDYYNIIESFSIVEMFDNRLFFSGSNTELNIVRCCELNNPLYIRDMAYYEIGNSVNQITALKVWNNLIWVLKMNRQDKDAVFYMTPEITDDGKVYTVQQGNIAQGCLVDAMNYKDTIVYLGTNGLESIAGSIQYSQSIIHKSSMVDSKMLIQEHYTDAIMEEYRGYLLIAIDNLIFLADYRQQFSGNTGREYEWYLWQFPINITMLKNFEGRLFIGDDDGNLYLMGGTNDDGEIINSYWTTPRDTLGYVNYYKTINKRGAMLILKAVPNAKIKFGAKTDKDEDYTTIKEISLKGFDFNDIDFNNMNFANENRIYEPFRLKRKKVIDVSYKIYSDELDKPFGIVGIVFQAYVGGYVKR